MLPPSLVVAEISEVDISCARFLGISGSVGYALQFYVASNIEHESILVDLDFDYHIF